MGAFDENILIHKNVNKKPEFRVNNIRGQRTSMNARICEFQ